MSILSLDCCMTHRPKNLMGYVDVLTSPSLYLFVSSETFNVRVKEADKSWLKQIATDVSCLEKGEVASEKSPVCKGNIRLANNFMLIGSFLIKLMKNVS